MNEQKLEKEFAIYRELAKQDKKIDVASLMISALQKHEANMISDKLKRWGYLISFIVPPFGLLFAYKFFTSGKDDSASTALWCLALTFVSVLLVVIFSKLLLVGVG